MSISNTQITSKTSLYDLQKVAKKLKIKDYEEYRKKDLYNKILRELENIEKSKRKVEKKYIIKEQIGNKGREGKTFLVVDNKFNTEYAMKRFRNNKSSDKLFSEVGFQRRASEYNISPKIVDFDIRNEKFIVMEKMDYHLTDEITFNGGLLSDSRQEELINIYKKLDKLKIFHGDANLLNYMIKDDKLFIIDFGMAQEIDEKLKQKLNTPTPNMKAMLLLFVMRLKESNCPKESYRILEKYL
jgi:tRNA A-37 threonylcarbamoyl transferase component Bud32